MFDSPWALDRVFCKFALKHPIGGSPYRSFALLHEMIIFAVIFLVVSIGDMKESLLHPNKHIPMGWQTPLFISAAVTLILLWLLPTLYYVARKEQEKSGAARIIDPAVPISYKIYRLTAKLAPNRSGRYVYSLLAVLFTAAILVLLGYCLMPTLDSTVKEILSRNKLFLGIPCATIILGATLFSALAPYSKVVEAMNETN